MEKKYFPVFVGDKVFLRFDHLLSFGRKDAEIEARVLEVTPRYGRVNHGQTQQNSLLKIRHCDTGEERYVDSGYVVSILDRSELASRPPRNIFSDERWTDPKFTKTAKRGIMCGPLAELAVTTLRNAHFFLPHPIDPVRLAALYEKQNIGLISKDEYHLYWVHKKPFARWARQNASRICKTTAERVKESTAFEMEFEKDYWKGVEDDLKRDFAAAEAEENFEHDDFGDGRDEY